MIYVIMLEPVTPGNVGAVARVMKNFSFDKLVLINPQCDPLCDEARNRAKHSQDVLENAEVCDFFIVDDYDYLVATTARLGTDYNISRSPLMPAELAAKLKKIDPSKKIGLVIGREGHGMFNEEIEKCDFVVTIPSTPGYSTLNISHAVAVILYELHKGLAENHVASHITPIGKQEKDQIMRMFAQVFDGWRWETAEKRETQELLWKKILGKSMLTKREAYAVMGFLRKILDVRQGKMPGVSERVEVKSAAVPSGSGGKAKAAGAARGRTGRAANLVKGSITKEAAQKKRMRKAGAKTRGVKAKPADAKKANARPAKAKVKRPKSAKKKSVAKKVPPKKASARRKTASKARRKKAVKR